MNNIIPSMLLLNKQKQLCLWPSCNTHPKTLSFRATTDQDPVFINPNKEPPVEPDVELTTLGSLFTNSPETASVSSESDSSAVETIVREARSERLFFEPDSTSSLLETQSSGGPCTLENNNNIDLPYKESVAMVMESGNPYVDFKRSMEEMVEINGLKDWECLEELLWWYLKMNDKDNYEFIVGAFVDLLVGISGDCRLGGEGDGDGSGGGISIVDHSVVSFSSGASSSSSPMLSPPNGN
ncbi:transcription repressor OFP13-like [Bidens hawaiensis]|uniref:transcription repressor OFP13-like n=1 Tax=Bidens hawaiensis TaxID=980011 RepID=UPI0040498C03